MADVELHYLSYDPEAIWREMTDVYIESGGDVLYGGDEKEMLLRAVQAVVVQVFAGVDNALRMATLRYAQGDYLKLLGEERGCPYNEAIAATGAAEVTWKGDGVKKQMPAGTVMTADGQRYFETMAAIVHSGEVQTMEVGTRCTQAGVLGNGVPVGTGMQLVAADASVGQIVVCRETAGGVAAEDMEVYRERVRTSGMKTATTGPSSQYEAVARAATGSVIDVKAVNGGPGVVDVNLLIEAAADEQAVMGCVEGALNDEAVRPLTDTVNVQPVGVKTYQIVVGYQVASPLKAEDGARALRQAADEYRQWQDNTIGRAFDPYRLMALLYQAGASRVVFQPESAFDGGSLQYSAVDAYTHVSGAIVLEVLDE